MIRFGHIILYSMAFQADKNQKATFDVGYSVLILDEYAQGHSICTTPEGTVYIDCNVSGIQWICTT